MNRANGRTNRDIGKLDVQDDEHFDALIRDSQEAQQFEKIFAHALLDICWLGFVQSRADGEKWAWTGRQDATRDGTARQTTGREAKVA